MTALVEDSEAAEGVRLPAWPRQQFLETPMEMFALEIEAWATGAVCGCCLPTSPHRRWLLSASRKIPSRTMIGLWHW